MKHATCFSCRHWMMPAAPAKTHPIVGMCGIVCDGIDWRPSTSTCEQYTPFPREPQKKKPE